MASSLTAHQERFRQRGWELLDSDGSGVVSSLEADLLSSIGLNSSHISELLSAAPFTREIYDQIVEEIPGLPRLIVKYNDSDYYCQVEIEELESLTSEQSLIQRAWEALDKDDSGAIEGPEIYQLLRLSGNMAHFQKAHFQTRK